MERANPQIEDELGIKFSIPDQAFVAGVQRKVDTIASVLGQPSLRLTPPTSGFLTKSLTPEQRKILDNVMGPIYAKGKVQAQDLLRTIPIIETGERMVPIRGTLQEAGLRASFSETPFHPACGEWAGKERVFWLREQVMRKVTQAARALQEVDTYIHFEDAFRPEGVQEGLFKRRFEWALRDHPDWSAEEVFIESRSKTTIAPYLAGHKGGASIDVTLRDGSNNPLPLGNQYPEGGMLVFIDCPYVIAEEWATRQLFRAPFYALDFYVNPAEDWHIDFGGLNHPTRKTSNENYSAIYGPIKGFDPETGEIEPYDRSESYTDFYTANQLFQLLKGKGHQ